MIYFINSIIILFNLDFFLMGKAEGLKNNLARGVCISNLPLYTSCIVVGISYTKSFTNINTRIQTTNILLPLLKKAQTEEKLRK